MTSVLPNFIIAGAARSGTSALAHFLSRHPDVFVTSPKEVHFYAHAGSPRRYEGPGDEEMINRQVITDPELFRTLMQPGARCRRRGDGSVSTLTRPDVSIPNIRRYADADVRIVVMLREPVARAYSSFLYLRGRGRETYEDFGDALAAERDRERANYHHLWLYRALSRYRRQLEPFVDAFGDRLRIVILEEYRNDAARANADLFRFLDVDDRFEVDATPEVNRGGEPKSASLMALMNAARSRPVLQETVKRLTTRRFRERIRSLNRMETEIDRALEERLVDEMSDEVAYVESLLGRRIDAWHR